jgi:Cytochrome c oxidase subunit IV
MKEQGLVFVATATFFVGIGVIYWFTSYEPTGTVLLCLGVGLGVIPGSFLLWHSLRAPAPLPEDRPDALPDDLAGRVGSFPESSVWPLVIAVGAAMTGIGLVFGVWAGLPGGVVVVIAFVGASLESRSQP